MYRLARSRTPRRFSASVAVLDSAKRSMAPRNDGRGGARTIRRKLEHRRSVEALVASSRAARPRLAARLGRPLPAREIGILDGQLHQRRGTPVGERLVQRRQLGEEHAIEGDAVEDDVVQGAGTADAGVGEAYEDRAHQWTPVQIEGSNRLLGGDRRASSSRSASGNDRRSTTGSEMPDGGWITWLTSRSTIRKVVRHAAGDDGGSRSGYARGRRRPGSRCSGS